MNPYFEQMILSASPIELIRLLYKRAISSLRDAREHLRSGSVARRAASVNNAYSVLLTLQEALRKDEAPEISGRLASLYDYMQRRLIEANFRQIDAPLAEVLGLLTTLAEAWDAVPEPRQAPPAAKNAWQMSEAAAPESLRVAISA